MPVQIPTSTTLDFYSEKVTLDGQTFTLEFLWNAREEFWYMNVLTDDNEPIAMGVKVVVNFPLLRRVANAQKPAGDIVAYDTTDIGIEAGLTELGTRVLLLYFSAEEIEAFNG